MTWEWKIGDPVDDANGDSRMLNIGVANKMMINKLKQENKLMP